MSAPGAQLVAETWALFRGSWHRVDGLRGRKARCRCTGRWAPYTELLTAGKAVDPGDVCAGCALLLAR